VTITNRVSLRSVEFGITPIDDVPDAPTIGAATNVGTSRAYNNGSATVAYTAAATGGPVTTFTATSTPGSFTATGASPITVTGLQSATSYTFAVSAANANGTLTSAASSSITATTVPNTPGTPTATITNATTVSLAFTAGATGGAAISSYTVTSSPSISLSTSGTSSPLTVTGTFAINQAYTFTITATNANGTSSASSASASITPNPDPAFIRTASGFYGWRGLAIAADNTEYFAASPSGYYGVVTVLDNSGNITANPALTNGSYNWSGTGSVAIGPSGSWYYSAAYPPSDGANPNGIMSKFNSSNVLQWSASIDYGSADAFYKVAVDSSGNAIGTGYRYNTGTTLYDAIVAKVNTSGVHQWSYYMSGGGSGYSNSDVAVDSSGNIYLWGVRYSSAYAVSTAVITKLNSAGSVQWVQGFSVSNGSGGGGGIKVDSSGNIYVSGTWNSPARTFVAKLDSSGAIIWQRSLSGTAAVNPGGISVDSSGNVYTVAYTTDSSVGKGVLVKYNSSGAIQWQRYLSSSVADAIYLYDCAVTPGATTVAISGQYSNNGLAAKFPTDGSKTGTYTVGSNTFTWAAANLTDAALSNTMSSNSLSLTSGNSTSSYSMTQSAVGYTETGFTTL
jgi:hypothetical protein